MRESTGRHWPGASWNLFLLLLMYFILAASSACSWQFTGMRVLLDLVAVVFPCWVVRLRGPCLLQSAHCVCTIVSVQHIQLLHICMHNPSVGSIICYICAMMWMSHARMCVSIGCVACVWASVGLCSLCWNWIEVVRGTCVVARVVCVCVCCVCIYPPGYLPACHSSRRVVENVVYQFMPLGSVSCVIQGGTLSMSVVIVRARQICWSGYAAR